MAKRRELTAEEKAAAIELRRLWDAQKGLKGLIQERVAFDFGWKQQSAVSQYLNGIIPLNLDALLKFAALLDVAPAEIFPELAANVPKAPAKDQGDLLDTGFKEKYERVAYVRGAMLSGGPGNTSWEYEEVSHHFAFRKDWLANKGLRPHRCRIYEVNGNSNAPYIQDGDVVMLNLDDRKIEADEFYGLAFGDDLRVKQLALRADGSLKVISAAEPEKAEIYRGDEINQLKIIGKVVWRGG